MDAPKQHELHHEHLAAFVAACAMLFAKQDPPFQLIVAAKDPDIFRKAPDAVWEPTYPSDDGFHYLG